MTTFVFQPKNHVFSPLIRKEHNFVQLSYILYTRTLNLRRQSKKKKIKKNLYFIYHTLLPTYYPDKSPVSLIFLWKMFMTIKYITQRRGNDVLFRSIFFSFLYLFIYFFLFHFSFLNLWKLPSIRCRNAIGEENT